MTREGGVSCLKMSEWGEDPELIIGFESGAIALVQLQCRNDPANSG